MCIILLPSPINIPNSTDKVKNFTAKIHQSLLMLPNRKSSPHTHLLHPKNIAPLSCNHINQFSVIMLLLLLRQVPEYIAETSWQLENTITNNERRG